MALSKAQQSYLRFLGHAPERPREPEPDFAPPPPYPVVWVVLDREDSFNRREVYAQTAYRAYELSGISRDGQRLSYSQCHVYHSEHLSKKGVEALVGMLQKLCEPGESKPKRARRRSDLKLNGHSKLNGKGESK